MAKNICAKFRDKDHPYEIWQAGDWTWRVCKKWQTLEKEANNEYARWYCYVTSPYCPEGEYGDVYVKDIKSVAHLVTSEELSHA